MAAATKNCWSLLHLNPNTARWRESFRLYSQFPPNMLEPVIEKQKVDSLLQLESKENLWATLRIPPRTEQSCSALYDEDKEKFINILFRKGKKEVARNVVDSALTKIKHVQLRKYYKEQDEEKRKEIVIDPLMVFHLAIKNVMPSLNTLKIKKSGTWYRVPTGITPKYAKFLAMRWIADTVRVNHGRNFSFELLVKEILNAYEFEGVAYKKKIELHRLCEANRGYAHYKWT